MYDALIWGCTISLLGSLVPGVIMLRIMEYGTQKLWSQAYVLLFFAVIFELLYASIALYAQFLSYTLDSLYGYMYLFVASTILLWLRAKYCFQYLLKHRSRLYESIFLGMTNLLPIPFWVGVTLHIKEWKLFYLEIENVWLYVMGIGIGTATALLLIAYLSSLWKMRSHKTWKLQWVYVTFAIYFFIKGVLILR